MTKGKNSDIQGLSEEVGEMFEKLDAGDKEIKIWIEQSRKNIRSIKKIPGDASTRKYYRVYLKSEPLKSMIAMKTAPFIKEGENVPFLEVRSHLKQSGIDVPEVFEFDAKKGFILLEDLGDVTLLRKLENVSDKQTELNLYKKLVDVLISFQINATPKRKSVQIAAFGLKFDYKKFFWEIENTIDHFYTKNLKRKISLKDKKTMERGFGEICQILADQPKVLAHRDFHSRNVMVTPADNEPKNDRLVLIDFQDARMGPAQYDLASLLRDSYYQLEESSIQLLVDHFISMKESLTKTNIDRDLFQLIFDLSCVQRNFKAIGSFASFYNLRKDITYLKYIGNTFENIRRVLMKYPQYTELREVLFHYYYF